MSGFEVLLASHCREAWHFQNLVDSQPSSCRAQPGSANFQQVAANITACLVLVSATALGSLGLVRLGWPAVLSMGVSVNWGTLLGYL